MYIQWRRYICARWCALGIPAFQVRLFLHYHLKNHNFAHSFGKTKQETEILHPSLKVLAPPLHISNSINMLNKCYKVIDLMFVGKFLTAVQMIFGDKLN